MNIIDYCKNKGGTGTPSCVQLAKLADKSACSALNLYQIALGHKRASWRLARRIESASRGKIPAEQFQPPVE